MNQMTKDFRNNVAQMFIKSLEEDQLSWRKNWKALNVLPQNAVTGTAYKGVNRFYLMFLCQQNEWEDPRFATFNQIKEKGWKLLKGSKGVKVEYWMPYDVEEKKIISWKEANLENKKVGLVPKYYTVFNARDIDGIPPMQEPERKDIKPDKILQTIQKNMHIEILHDGKDRAFYRPSEDTIHLPEPEYFESDHAYNTTAMHELAHATGAPHRLNRDLKNLFGSAEYAYEELIAEISAVFMSNELSSCMEPYEMDNHKAYVQSWISHIKEKPEILMQAIKEANKAADYLEEMAELVPQKAKENAIEVDAEKIVEVSADREAVSYRQQVSAIYEYEVKNNIPENDRMTKWYAEMEIAVAKPWYKENDPSVIDRAEGARRIPISEASIAERYNEITKIQQKISEIIDINNQYSFNAVKVELEAREGQKIDYAVNNNFNDFSNEDLRAAVEFMEKENAPIPMNEQEYLDNKGVGSPFGEYQDDKLIGHMKVLTQESTKKDFWNTSNNYWNKRETARKEYHEMTKEGLVREKSILENTIEKASGNPENASVQAARRMLDKRGITGEHLNLKQNPTELRRKEILKDFASNDIRPTKKLISNMQKLDVRTGKKNTVKDIMKMHKQKDVLSSIPKETKELMNQIVKECKMQQMELCR